MATTLSTSYNWQKSNVTYIHLSLSVYTKILESGLYSLLPLPSINSSRCCDVVCVSTAAHQDASDVPPAHSNGHISLSIFNGLFSSIFPSWLLSPLLSGFWTLSCSSYNLLLLECTLSSLSLMLECVKSWSGPFACLHSLYTWSHVSPWL